MKIQLNSLPALERLIGGDTEVELDLRRSVAAQFVDKHMKGLVTEACDPVSDLAKGIKAHAEKELESVKTQADKAIQEFIDENMQLAGNTKVCTNPNSYWAKRYEFKLSQTTKAEIEQKVRWASTDLVEKAITEGIKAFKPQLGAMIEKALSATMQKQVEQMVRQKIEAVLKS